MFGSYKGSSELLLKTWHVSCIGATYRSPLTGHHKDLSIEFTYKSITYITYIVINMGGVNGSSIIHQCANNNYVIMWHLHVLDTYILNIYDMMHENDHKLNLKSLHFIKVRVTYLLYPINHLTRTVAIIGFLTFQVSQAWSYKIKF